MKSDFVVPDSNLELDTAILNQDPIWRSDFFDREMTSKSGPLQTAILSSSTECEARSAYRNDRGPFFSKGADRAPEKFVLTQLLRRILAGTIHNPS